MKRTVKNLGNVNEAKARLVLLLVTLSMLALSAGAPAGFGGVGG